MAVATIIELLGKEKGRPVRYTVADGVAIPKGTLMKVIEPRTAEATDGDDKPFCGIAATEKVISDGSTTLACYTHGIFKLTNSATTALTAGMRVQIKAANEIDVVDNATLFAEVGIALQDIAKSADGAVLIGSGL